MIHILAVGGAATLALSSWPTILSGLCGLGSSQLTAFLSHKAAPTWVKSGIALCLSTLSGVLITVTVVPGNTWKDYVSLIGLTWITALFSHVAGLTALVENKTADVGVGKNVPPLVKPAVVAPTPDDTLSDEEQEAAMASRGVNG
jgi:hypothetical protein